MNVLKNCPSSSSTNPARTATIAVAASAAEVIIAGVITKVAGIIGGAVGLSFGVNKFLKVKKKRNSEDY